jgi:trigger factor
LNVQTEQLDNHSARLTVQVEPERIEKAKEQAARDLSKRYKIPGFRPGKAPLKMVMNYVGEAAVLERAVQKVGDEIYRDALREANVSPYSTGSLEDYQPETFTFIFTVPLQPTVTLHDHRSVRAAYEAPVVTDEQFEKAMIQLQEREAVSEESSEPIAWGNRVTVDIHSEFADGDEREEGDEGGHSHSHDHDHDDDHDHDEEDEAEAAEDEIVAESQASVEAAAGVESEAKEDESEESESDDADDEDADDKKVYKGDEFIHQHDAAFVLKEGEEPVIAGFAAGLIGAKAGDEVEIELTVPDEENYKDVAGRKVVFHVHVKKVETLSLPEINDEFAAKLTADEETPLTLEQLRERVRNNMVKDTERKARDAFGNGILDQVIARAEISYPDVMVQERIEELLKDLDGNLRQQGFTLDAYQKATGLTKDNLYAMYQPQAETNLKRTLVLGELLTAEQLTVTEDDIETRANEMIESIKSENRDSLRKFLKSSAQRSRILNNMLYERVMDRLVQIGRGEELPELTEASHAETTSSAEGSAE